MILEVAILNVIPGEQTAFEAAFTRAAPILTSMPGYIAHELRLCVENRSRYLLLVQWQTIEDHTVGFRQSERFTRWRALIGSYFQSPPEVIHLAPVEGLV